MRRRKEKSLQFADSLPLDSAGKVLRNHVKELQKELIG